LVSGETVHYLPEGYGNRVSNTNRIGWHRWGVGEGNNGIGEVVFMNCELVRAPANERYDRQSGKTLQGSGHATGPPSVHQPGPNRAGAKSSGLSFDIQLCPPV